VLYITLPIASWQRGEATAPLKFHPVEKFSYCPKISFQKYQILGLQIPILNECRVKMEIFSTRIACQKFAVVCRKTATSCPQTFLTHDAAENDKLTPQYILQGGPEKIAQTLPCYYFWTLCPRIAMFTSKCAAETAVDRPIENICLVDKYSLLIGWKHRSIYKYLDRGLPSPSVTKFESVKLTSHTQHASRWRMRGSQTCRLLCLCCHGIGLYARKFQNEITLGRRAHVRKMFVSLTHSPDSACDIHICNKV